MDKDGMPLDVLAGRWPRPNWDLDPGHDAMPKGYRNLDPGHDAAGRGFHIYDDKPTDKEPPTPIRLPLKDDGYIVGVSTEKEADRGEWANPPIIEDIKKWQCVETRTYHHLIDGECSECGFYVLDAEEQYGEMLMTKPEGEYTTEWFDASLPNMPKVFSEADLLRLAGQLEAAMEQGWVFKRYLPCGDREHRHGWRFTAWLCEVIKGVK